MNNDDQQEIERHLHPFQEACSKEGYAVQCHLVPVPNPDHELFRDTPIRFRLNVIESEIRSRHYLDTWILFRRLLRETVERNIRQRFLDFNIYPTLEASELPLPPIPHSETTELFNRLLHIFYWVFIDIRLLSYSKEDNARNAVTNLTDALHNVPKDMFFWSYGNDGWSWNTFDFTYSNLEDFEEDQKTCDDVRHCYYLQYLEMDYNSFLESTLRPYGNR